MKDIEQTKKIFKIIEDIIKTQKERIDSLEKRIKILENKS